MEGCIFLKYTFAECKRSFVEVPMFGHFRVLLMFTVAVFYHLLFTNVKYFVFNLNSKILQHSQNFVLFEVILKLCYEILSVALFQHRLSYIL